MILPLAMSVAGSVPVILTILYCLISKDDFDAKAALKFLKLSIFFFLVPIQLIYHLLPTASDIFPSLIHYNSAGVYVMNFEGKYQLQINDEIVLIPYWLIIFSVLSVIIMFCFLLYETFSYKKACTALSSEKHISSPLTIGFFRPRILLPDNLEDEQEIIMLYKHEQGHVKQHDSLFRFFCLLVLCLHWYNPFAWILLFFYPFISECACDQNAIMYFSNDKKKKYSSLLINYAASGDPLPWAWKNSFSSGGRKLKRRLKYIMKRKNRTVINTLVLITFAIITFASSCTTVIAYSPLEKSNSIPDPDYKITDITIIPDGVEDPELAIDDFSNSDTILTTEDNEIIPILSSSDSTYRACSHVYTEGTQKIHTKNSSGGCVVTVYKVTYFSKCNYIKSKSFVSQTSYAVCPH